MAIPINRSRYARLLIRTNLPLLGELQFDNSRTLHNENTSRVPESHCLIILLLLLALEGRGAQSSRRSFLSCNLAFCPSSPLGDVITPLASCLLPVCLLSMIALPICCCCVSTHAASISLGLHCALVPFHLAYSVCYVIALHYGLALSAVLRTRRRRSLDRSIVFLTISPRSPME